MPTRAFSGRLGRSVATDYVRAAAALDKIQGPVIHEKNQLIAKFLPGLDGPADAKNGKAMS